MCEFCDKIYPDDDTEDIVFARGMYPEGGPSEFITVDEKGQFHINVDPGDPYELGVVSNIKFCPYCGMSLTRVFELWTNAKNDPFLKNELEQTRKRLEKEMNHLPEYLSMIEGKFEKGDINEQKQNS